MSSWNRPSDPFASFSSSVEAAGETQVGVTPWIEMERVPSWLRPFTLDANTRFTRTPDVFLRGRAKPDEAQEPVVSLPPVTEAMSPSTDDDMENEDILIDWTGESWAARIAEGTRAFERAVEELPAPIETTEPPELVPAENPEPPSPAEEVAEEASATGSETGDEAGLHEGEAASPVEADITRLEELPDGIRRLARLIAIAPEEIPAPAVEQDLAAPLPEEAKPSEGDEVKTPATMPADVPEPVETALLDEQAPAPVAATGGEPRPAAVMALSPFGLGVPVRVSFGWPLVAPAAPSVPQEAPRPLTAEAAPKSAPKAPRPSIGREGEPERGESGLMAADYQLPPLELLTEPPVLEPAFELSEEALDRNSAALQQTLRDFGVRGEIIDANPGPVVTLYEFEPAPGTKSSRVIGLSADIARSMSAVSARVAVVEGRNVIGIELPNQRRETVWLRELLASHAFADARARLGLCLGKTIGGEAVIVDLARMPHLLVAGTTGSGKSVAINTMILSLLYRLTPEQCRLIMIDPKMLELSVYEGIPHLLTPVVTDPKKAIIALQWAVREMEDRYRKMSRLKVRNIEGFNARVTEARRNGEVITVTVESGFDRETGEMIREEVEMDLSPLPYIVIIVDEMADLMMVAGKDIEGAIQRLAQMARAAGIHLVMATQRPSVDVITGTIKANFPTRISFQVTSKIDSRTILGEMGAETLLGQGDMLYMANGGRITRVHGPFVSDGEVEQVVAHLKAQGRPEYLDAVTSDDEGMEEEEDGAVFDKTALAAEDGADHYEQAVAVVLRDRKASTSYIQRRLQIGYNKAASLMERMEAEGIVGPANHAGKREILSSRTV